MGLLQPLNNDRNQLGGLEQGINAYYEALDRKQAKEQQDKMYQLALAEHGLQAGGPGGGLIDTPELAARKQRESQMGDLALQSKKYEVEQQPIRDQAGFLKEGVQKNADTGLMELNPHAAKMQALDERYRAAQAIKDEAEGQRYKAESMGGGAKGQAKAYTDVSKQLEMMRGNPAVQQAERDIYSSDKAQGLINLYPDVNKLSPSQVRLLAQEVGKIASGGAPTEHELQGITPDTFKGQLANITQIFTNAPSKANAGEFIKQYKDYLNVLRGDAQHTITDRYGRILNAQKSHLNQGDYDTLNGLYLNRFENPNQPSPASQGLVGQGNAGEHAAAVNWAKQNPNDPRSAAILKAATQNLGQ